LGAGLACKNSGPAGSNKVLDIMFSIPIAIGIFRRQMNHPAASSWVSLARARGTFKNYTKTLSITFFKERQIIVLNSYRK